MKNKRKNIIYSSILLTLLIILGFLFIYTGDDWAWGSQIGLNRLNTFFKNYNSRYLGNLTVLLLTRSNLLKSIVIGTILFGIINLLAKITNNKRIDLYLISTILILNTPKLIFKESISWTSGFSNYATSTFLMLIFFYYIKNIQKKRLDNHINFKTILLFILGLSSSLFIENFTIYNLLLSIFIVVYHKFKYKEFNKNLISHTIGSTTGFLLMFLNLSSSTSGNREIASTIKDLFLRLCNNYFGIIYEELIYHNIIINTILIIFVYLLMKKLKTTKTQKKSFYFSLSYIIYSIINILYPTWNILLDYTPHFEGIYTGIYIITTSYLLISLIKEKLLKERIIFYITSIIILTLPLLIVSPIGSRLFFITYTIFIIIVLELYNYLFKENIINNRILKTLLLIISLSFIHLFSINITTYIENKIRLNKTNNDIKENKELIKLKRFTYEDYIHGEATPTPNTIWEDRYKLFYKIPDDKKIIIIEKELANN